MPVGFIQYLLTHLLYPIINVYLATGSAESALTREANNPFSIMTMMWIAIWSQVSGKAHLFCATLQHLIDGFYY